jgi:GIY-YIG catalytic domain
MNKSTMKKAYKDAKRSMGVYRIASSRNDKVYIGFDTNLPARINRHKAELKFGNHRNRELQEIWNLFGERAIDFEVLDVLDHQENSQANPVEELQVLLEMWHRKLERDGFSIVTL